MSDCNPCVEPSCGCPLPSCATTLVLGSVGLLNTIVFVHIVKANGAEHIEQVTTSAQGVINLPLNSPSTAFYNHLDGVYKVFVMSGGYFCQDDKLTVTSGNRTWTTVAFEFRFSSIDYTIINLEIAV
jgi:hypothetical protein